MIDLLIASQIAGIAGNAVAILDKVYTQFVAFKQKRNPSEVGNPHLQIVNEPQANQIATRNVVQGDGQLYQAVTYQELSARLDPRDALK
jgi:hypothetical protein